MCMFTIMMRLNAIIKSNVTNAKARATNAIFHTKPKNVDRKLLSSAHVPIVIGDKHAFLNTTFVA